MAVFGQFDLKKQQYCITCLFLCHNCLNGQIKIKRHIGKRIHSYQTNRIPLPYEILALWDTSTSTWLKMVNELYLYIAKWHLEVIRHGPLRLKHHLFKTKTPDFKSHSEHMFCKHRLNKPGSTISTSRFTISNFIVLFFYKVRPHRHSFDYSNHGLHHSF